MTPRLTAARVAVVSGKGGVGKTTVAAALALAAAAAGKRTLLLEVEGRESVAPLFGLDAIGYQERPLAPNLSALSVVPDDALVEYLALFYGIGRIGKAVARTKVIEFATSTAPGLRDILLIGKVKEAERRRVEGRPAFDLLVLDAPPTGRLPRFLNAPRAVAELARGGPIKTQAQGVIDMVHDAKRLHVVLVAIPEEMAVQETIEAAEALEQMGVARGPVVVNGLWPSPPVKGAQPRAKLAREAAKAGVALADPALDALAAIATATARRAANHEEALAQLSAALPMPLVRLPFLFTPGVARPDVETLADALRAQGAI